MFECNNLLEYVPSEYKLYLRNKIIVLPINVVYNSYSIDKTNLLEKINNSKNAEINSMHKYSFVSPLKNEIHESINNKLFPLVKDFYKLNNNFPNFYTGFAFQYVNNGQNKLNLHTDDSLYTVNLCLENSSDNNEVVFLQSNGKEIPIYLKEDYMLIHLGNQPHYTNKLSDGKRTNIVLWYK